MCCYTGKSFCSLAVSEKILESDDSHGLSHDNMLRNIQLRGRAISIIPCLFLDITIKI